MRTLPEALDWRVLLTDGATARQLRSSPIDTARDLYGAEGCLEVLNLTRAELVRRVHVAYLEAGADVIRTNSLQASPLSLEPHGLAEEAFYINYAAAEIASQAVDGVPGRGRRRFVLGVVRDQGWDLAPELIDKAVATQVEGLLAGGVDGIALDLMPGTGRTHLFLRGAQRAKEKLGARAPILLQRGCEGAEFSARMQSLADGVIRYRHGQVERAGWLKTAIAGQQVNLVGGGASPGDTVLLDRMLRDRAEDGLRPVTQWHRDLPVDEVEPASSTLYQEISPAHSLAEAHAPVGDGD